MEVFQSEVLRRDGDLRSHDTRGSSRPTGVNGAEMVVQRHGKANAKIAGFLGGDRRQHL
jgi:hypothetical protein